jgi:hypothetical protein
MACSFSRVATAVVVSSFRHGKIIGEQPHEIARSGRVTTVTKRTKVELKAE